MSNVLKMPGIKEVPKDTPRTDRSSMETMLLTPQGVERWRKPPFQRELRETPRVVALAEEIKKESGILPGIITLGQLGGELYLVDGQHRLHAFKLSGLSEGLADVRVRYFKTMAEMSAEFIELNGALVRMRTDDITRAQEERNEHIAQLRKRCPFVGYDHIRSAGGKTLLSMATAIRIWFGSAGETPSTGPASSDAINMLNAEEGDKLARFLQMCFAAWGRDTEHFRLWSALNLGILMWLWRRIVLGTNLPPYRGGSRILSIKADTFEKCCMGLAADSRYTEWLIGRALRERDRPPCYSRIREIFTRRLAIEGIRGPRFPHEDWTKS